MFPDGEISRRSALLPTPTADQPGGTATQHLARKARMPDGANRTSVTDLRMKIEVLTSSSEDSPASPSPQPARPKRKPITAGYGPSSPESFASLDPDGSWLRTYPDSSVQASLLGPLLARFSGTWPKQGSMRDGVVYGLPMSALPTDANGSFSLLRTVHGMSGGSNGKPYDGHGSELSQQIYDMLPTPKTPTGGSEAREAREARGSGGEDLEARLRSLGEPMEPLSNDGSEP